jgi:hypothetical protein
VYHQRRLCCGVPSCSVLALVPMADGSPTGAWSPPGGLTDAHRAMHTTCRQIRGRFGLMRSSARYRIERKMPHPTPVQSDFHCPPAPVLVLVPQ